MTPQKCVTPEGGVTFYVLCLVESCVIPCGTLDVHAISQSGVTPEGGVTWRVALHMLLHSMHDA